MTESALASNHMHQTEHSHPWQVAIGGLALLTIASYVLSWRDVPLFFDESAFRRFLGRAFIDGFVQYSFFPVCAEPAAVPLIFIPAHALLSWVDGLTSWAGVRAIPISALAGLVATSALLMRQQSTAWGYGLAILCGGFVGLSGVGLVLSRWEFIVTLHITVCLLSWLVARLGSPSTIVVAVLLILNLLVILLSLFVHPQGMLVMPLNFLACMYLLRGRLWFSLAVAIVMAGLSVQAIKHSEFRCPEDPALVDMMAKTHGVVLSNQLAAYSLPERIVRRLVHYEQQFLFQHKEQYSIPVPKVSKSIAASLILPIVGVVTLNIVGIVFGAAWALYLLWKDFRALVPGRHWSALLRAIRDDGRVLWLVSALLLLLYSAIDAGGVFYRADYRNLLSAVLLAISVSYLLGRGNMMWPKLWASITFATSAISAVVAWLFLAPQLAAGYESYYVSLQRDWPAYNARISALAGQCGISPRDGRVVVDVATYDALRQYPNPIDFNYVWYKEYLMGEQKGRTAQQWLDYYKQYGTSGYVVMCRTLEFAPLSIQHRDGDLCCMKF